MNKQLLTILSSAAVLFAACSGPAEEPTINALTVYSSTPALTYDDPAVPNAAFTFMALGDDGSDYTADINTTFYVNNVAISGNKHTPTAEGKLTVHAVYKDVSSNTLTVEAVSRNINLRSLTVTSSVNEVEAGSGDRFTFTVTGQRVNGENLNVTALSGVKLYVDDALIQSNTYTPAEVKNYTVHAVYNDTLRSAPITVKGITSASIYVHRVLLEDFTSIHCGWCTVAINNMDYIREETDKVECAALHFPFSGAADPFYNSAFTDLRNAIADNTFPYVKINREEEWDTYYEEPLERIQESSPYGIAITSELGSSSGTVNVSISFKKALPSAKLVMYVLEDNLIAKQENYEPDLYGGVGVIPNFNHMDVVRTDAGTILGQAIPADKSALGAEYSVQLTPSYTSVDIANLSVLVAVLDGSGQVVNVRRVPANGAYEYELKTN